jgi:hypothetical protein
MFINNDDDFGDFFKKSMRDEYPIQEIILSF